MGLFLLPYFFVSSYLWLLQVAGSRDDEQFSSTRESGFVFGHAGV
jgi:hypothetical protein